MSSYYSGKRTRNIFDPASKEPFRLSRSRLDNFLRCPRCFYLDRRMGIDQPPGYPFSLNNAVDTLLKKEFNIHRNAKTTHPLMRHYGIDAVPFQHEKMDDWRNTFVGVQYLHTPTNFLVMGAVDDIWINKEGKLLVVDYKATSKDGEVTLDAAWQNGYKRQMEFYQWLLRKNGFIVSNTGYFVYVNGKTDVQAFDAKLEFDVKIISYEGSDGWVEDALLRAKQCLLANAIPSAHGDCDYCLYRRIAKEAEA